MKTETMRAFLVTGTRQADVANVPVPSAASDEVLLRVLACGLCKTDAKIFMSGHRDLLLPRIPGHELVGMDLQSGRRYAVFPGKTCGVCSYCNAGAQNLCPSVEIFGFSREGGLAEKIAVPKSSLIPLAPDISPELATLAEPLGCCVNAFSQMALPPRTDILIFGAGVMGLLLAFAAHKMNLCPVLCDIDPDRIKTSRAFLQPFSIPSFLRKDISYPVSAAITATSAPDAAEDALSLLKPGGAYFHFSGIGHRGNLSGKSFDQIHYKQLKVCGAYGCAKIHMETALKWIASSPDELSRLLKTRFSLSRIPEILPILWQGSGYRHIVQP
ncbi:MAG: alcohol dehydrogenase catalytic domain-containing protein [Acidobacteriota bacterium]|jgi:threonine dehydrogenase-like Zn-dependent dehydrogenase|nr:alcohol dehydrogenase catalytic domain-containing protein [Acidobacteriota bacterium]